MINFIRKYKLSYVWFNFFQKKKLSHNIPVLKKYGINKKYYSSISSKDFEAIADKFPREENPTAIVNSSFYKKQSAQTQQSLQDFYQNGYAIVNDFLSSETVDAINAEIDNLQKTGTLKFKYGNKLMFAIHHSEMIKSIGQDTDLLHFLGLLIGSKAQLFQSINFINGSEQKTHSDSIHMTTFPQGGLLGVWIALEDIDHSNGPLHYYPKSHRLPYYMNGDYHNQGTQYKLGDKGYKAYEEMLEEKVKSLGLTKEVFTCKKGDMLIWHANILHGGEAHTNKNKTRKSMVFHYFDDQSICYHEITQRPALF